MQWFLILPLAIALTDSVIADDSAATLAARTLYKHGDRLYVWAVRGLNLRQQPSPSAPVVRKLPYGASVTVVKHDELPVPYRFEFFPKKSAANTLTQIAHEQPQVILDGQWIRVKLAQQEGYLFDKLLLDVAPKRHSEALQAYLVRVFGLSSPQRQAKEHKDDVSGITYTTVYQTFTSKTNSVVLTIEESDGDASTMANKGRISIPAISFEKAFVFFCAIFPPLADHGFHYQAGQEFEYLLDEIGNIARLTKTNSGVLFEWHFSID